MFRKNRNANKAKLEHKLYLARENPDPVFDLSECDLETVPPGIFSLCRVFLKESLRLERNRLTGLETGGSLSDLRLLKILDLTDNRFRSIPDGISRLENLEELYLSGNQIKVLPDGLCDLNRLRVLDLSRNRIRWLPDRFGDIPHVHTLKLTGNEITHLPKSCHRWTGLRVLETDVDKMVYPPVETVASGARTVVRFICDDLGVPFERPDETDDVVDEAHAQTERKDSLDNLQGRLQQLEDIKLQRVQDFLEIERYNEHAQQLELEVVETSRLNRRKLLLELTEQQTQLDRELYELQRRKDSERFKLIEQLQEAEDSADKVIRQLLGNNREPNLQLLELQWLEEEEVKLQVGNEEVLHKERILVAMKELLEEEAARFQRLDQDRIYSHQSILESQLRDDSILSAALKSREDYKRDLVERLNSDDHLQRAAVAALLERGDCRSWGLLQQIKLVETQLVALTNIEIDKRKLQIDQQMSDLCEKRVNLSALLIELLSKQKERRAQLVSTLEAIEEQNERGIEDFWLRQYQSLLNKLPEGLAEAQRAIDVELSGAFLANGVIHCLPFLARIIASKRDLRRIDDSDLTRVGISNSDERQKVIEALRCYEKTDRWEREGGPPSAPPMEEDEEASAPLPENFRKISTVECVVCMDLECEIIFVPCGHFCSCRDCSKSLTECPMCRSGIERKIALIES